jgi:hypothetical protein
MTSQPSPPRKHASDKRGNFAAFAANYHHSDAHITSGGPLDDFPSPDLGGEHCDPSVSPGPGSKRVLPIHLPQLPGELSTETEKEFGGFKYMVVSHSSVRAFEYLRER